MPSPLHLLTVWNPSYASDTMDQHLAVLLRWGARLRAGEVESDDVYVWWAKVRSPRRRAALPHHADILALQEQIDGGVETHLYLTDYRSLYVGWLGRIGEASPLSEHAEKDHIPSYYAEASWPYDFWFRLCDIRCIVLDDTLQSCDELRKLRNLRYHDSPVSIYGGMVDVPLIVRTTAPHPWFEGRDGMTGGKLWAEYDAEIRGETSRLAKELRDNLFGRSLWGEMEPESRRFLAAGEALFRTRKDDPSFDFATALIEYVKAVETELNALLFPAIRAKVESISPGKRVVKLDDRRDLDLAAPAPHQGLGTIHHLLKNGGLFQEAVRTALQLDAKWLLERLPRELEKLIGFRNPAAHAGFHGMEGIDPLRAELLGIGCEGLLVQILRAKLRGRAQVS